MFLHRKNGLLLKYDVIIFFSGNSSDSRFCFGFFQIIFNFYSIPTQESAANTNITTRGYKHGTLL